MPDPISWPDLIRAAWPLWFALGVTLIVGTAGHWNRIIDHATSRPDVVLAWLRIRYGITPHRNVLGVMELRTRRNLRILEAQTAADLYCRHIRDKGVK